jgi:nitroreductase
LNYNGKPHKYAWYDLGLAMGNLSLQATSLGIYLHQMAGFDTEKARELLEIPEDYEAVTAIALGYLGDPEKLPDNLKERENAPRNRK